MIKRKLLVEEKESTKKEPPELRGRKLRKKADVIKLPDAIVDGKLVCGLESEIVVEKYRDGKYVYTTCTIKKIDEDGLVHTWDETVHQWYMWSLKNPPNLVKINLIK